MISAKQKHNNLGFLDTAIILIGAATLSLFLLWIVGQLQGRELFDDLPPWLSSIFSSAWGFATSAGASVFLLAVRRRIESNQRQPNFLLWIGGTALVLLAAVLGLNALLGNTVPAIHEATTAALKFSFAAPESGEADESRADILRFHEWEPVLRQARNIVRQPTDLFEETVDLPAEGERFIAHIGRIEESSVLTENPLRPSIQICLSRSSDKAASSQAYVSLECVESQGCTLAPLDPGWVDLCVGEWGLLRHLGVSVAYAQEPPPARQQKGWRVPSLETLKAMTAREKVGYTEFTIESDIVANAADIKYYTYAIHVNDIPLYFDGWLAHERPYKLEPDGRIRFSFGLETLNFSGLDRGREHIQAAIQLHHMDGRSDEVELNRYYVALRDADPIEVQTPVGSCRWAGTYVHPINEDKFEIFVRSTPDIVEAERLRERLDAATAAFGGMPVVGVIRPPLGTNDDFGVVIGLQQASGQIKFTFSSKESADLCAWVTSVTDERLKLVFHQDTYRYEMDPLPAGHPRIKLCRSL